MGTCPSTEGERCLLCTGQLPVVQEPILGGQKMLTAGVARRSTRAERISRSGSAGGQLMARFSSVTQRRESQLTGNLEGTELRSTRALFSMPSLVLEWSDTVRRLRHSLA